MIRAVRAAFEKKRARGDVSKISSLTYCANAVEVVWEMERRGLVGAHGPRLVAGRARALRRGAAGCASWPRRLARPKRPLPAGADAAVRRRGAPAAREAVEALDPAAGLEELEEELGKAEKTLVKKLEKALGETEREASRAPSRKKPATSRR